MVIKLALGFLWGIICAKIYGDITTAFLWTFLSGIAVMTFIDMFYFD